MEDIKCIDACCFVTIFNSLRFYGEIVWNSPEILLEFIRSENRRQNVYHH